MTSSTVQLRHPSCAGTMLLITAVGFSCLFFPVQAGAQDRFERFERTLNRLQQHLKVPGMSAVILENQEVVWAKGFGHADIDSGIRATPDTPYHLCSITKPIAATLLLQLVEQGKLSLDDPAEGYGIDLESQGDIQLKHILTHTTHGVPGTAFNYDGDRFCTFDLAVKKASGKSTRDLAIEKIFFPLGMTRSAPNMADAEVLDRFILHMKERGREDPITFLDGYKCNVSSLFLSKVPSDRMGRGYWFSYKVAVHLIDRALIAAGVDVSRFRHIRGADTLNFSEDTRRHFNEHWIEKNRRFIPVYRSLATPYQVDEQFNIVPGHYSRFDGPGAGYISSVMDLARFDIAYDRNKFITAETRERAYTPARTPAGEELPYGLGWFTQEHEGVRLIWHGGEWQGASGLYLKVPEKNLTFIVLANSRNMSQAFNMVLGDVLESGPGLAFLKQFVYEERFGEQEQDIDWEAEPGRIVEALGCIENQDLLNLYRQELCITAWMFARMGRPETRDRLMNAVYVPLFCDSSIREYEGQPVLAEITEVGNDEDRTQDFDLAEDRKIRIYAAGESLEEKFFDYGWIEDRVTGDIVWTMLNSEIRPAGGDGKNVKVDRVLDLPPGSYRLHYKSDDSHSFRNWNALPPDRTFWGIRIYDARKTTGHRFLLLPEDAG